MKQKPAAARKIALLRKTINKSQAQFAAMLGVSKETIISVENGRNQLSPKLALRIFICTGANLLAKNAPAGSFASELVPGEGYTAASLDAYNKYTANAGISGDLFYREKLKYWLDVLFRATEGKMLAGNRHVAMNLAMSLFEWIHEQRKTLKIASEMERVLEDETRKIQRDCDYVGMLRENPGELERYAETLGIDCSALQKILAARNETDLIMVKYEVYSPFKWILSDDFSSGVRRRKLLTKPKYWFKSLPKEVVSKQIRQISPKKFSQMPHLTPAQNRKTQKKK